MLFNWEKSFKTPSLILIGGRPCMGKTQVALKLAKKISALDKVRFIEAEECSSRQDFEKQLYDKSDAEVLIVDTIQNLTNKMAEDDDSFALEQLERFVNQNGCSVIVTSELSRNVEERKNHFPSLWDLADKVQKTDVFDFVGLLYRESYYNFLGCNDTHLFFKDRNDRNIFVLSTTDLKN